MKHLKEKVDLLDRVACDEHGEAVFVVDVLELIEKERLRTEELLEKALEEFHKLALMNARGDFYWAGAYAGFAQAINDIWRSL